MTPDAVTLFREVADRSAAEREEYYVRECVPAELRAEVESLLRFDRETAGEIRGRVAAAVDVVLDSEGFRHIPHVGAETAGATLGSYRLTEPLGQGGMGTVWRAEQERPMRRTVAVKVARAGVNSRDVVARFEAERQALAILNHRHIASVFDAGITADGRPYFVMEYIAGEPITSFADRLGLSVPDRLRLFLQVCDAVQHAHQKGVLHRDLKPTNILVSEEDGRPIAKVIDFGIAKAIGQQLTGETLQTEAGVLIGTPEYMSPEQAGLVDAAVDTRTDIYSLGLVLYELLAGALPFGMNALRGRPVTEVLRIVREAQPPRLATRLRLQSEETRTDIARARRTDSKALLRQLRGDLEWVTARALEKEPALRYASVSELRGDVDRYLQGEPVLAGPPSALYRIRKLARRHRPAVAALAVVAFTITASAIVATLAFVRAVRAEDRTRRQLIGTLVMQGMEKVDDADPIAGLLYLTKALELETDGDRMRGHRTRIGETLQRSPILVRLWRHAAPIQMLALSSRGLIASGSADGIVQVRDLYSGASRTGLRFDDAVMAGAFSRDGALLAVAAADGRLRIWRHEDGAVVREFRHSAPLVGTAFSPDATSVAAIGDDGRVIAWDGQTGTIRFDGTHEGRGTAVAFSHSGALLATAGTDGVRVWRVPTGDAAAFFRHESFRPRLDLAFSNDDRWLATGGADSVARLWEIGSNEPKATMPHEGAVTSIRFTDHSDLLVTTSMDHTTRLWRVPEGTPVRSPLVSASILGESDVSRYRMIASSAQGGTVDLWWISGRRLATLPHAGVYFSRFDATGRFLCTAGQDGFIRLWDVAPALPTPPAFETELPDFTWRVLSSTDGRLLAISSGARAERGAIRVFDAASMAPVTPVMRLDTLNAGFALSPDGRRLVTASAAGSRLWDLVTGEPLTPVLPEEVPLNLAGFSPDGSSFIVGSGREAIGGVRLRSTADGHALTALLAHSSPVIEVKFSPDGRRFATLTSAPTANVKLWSSETGQLLWTGTHKNGVRSMVWAPDGDTLLTGGGDQRVWTWTASTGTARVLGLTMAGEVSTLGVSRDGRRLLAGTPGGDLRLTPLQLDGASPIPIPHRGFIYQSHFSPDGSVFLTSAGDHTARLWDGTTGEFLTPRLDAGQISRGATFVGSRDRWAWTGSGLFIDELTEDERPGRLLSTLIESVAGRALTDSGRDVPLLPAEIEARFADVHRTGDVLLPPAPADYLRFAAAAARANGAYAESIAALLALRAQQPLRWTDTVRLLGAYAASRRWQESLSELQQQRSHWRAAPELVFFEAVALMRLGDREGAIRHCRAALDATLGTRHPERAYWSARACLLVPRIADADRAELEARVDIAYDTVFTTLGRNDLKGMLLIRDGRPREALALFQAATPSPSSRMVFLLQALAARRAGLYGEAAARLSQADATPGRPAPNHIDAFFDAEADVLRAEVVAGTATPSRR